MSMINLKTTLISMDGTTKNETKGILTDGKLSYEENGAKTTVSIEENMVIMLVKDDEHVLELTFKNQEQTSGIYTLYSTNSKISIDIYTKLLQIENNCIKIVYNFYDEERTYEIEYEVIV